MNPARSFGPDLALADFTNYWVYVVGPFTGAAVAVGTAWVLRGAGGDRGGLAAARGTLAAANADVEHVSKEARQ
jgi:aquaporin Z